MYTHKIPASSLWAWICAAVAGPAAVMAAGCSWPVSLGLGLGTGVLCVWSLSGGGGELPRPVLALEAVWAGVMLCWALQESGHIWSGPGAYPAVPLILLALGVWASSENTRGPRIGAVCLRLLVLLLGFVILCALGDVRPEWTAPGISGRWAPLTLALLLPAGAFLLPREGKMCRKWALLPAALAVGISLCAGGVLSPWVAEELPDALWELGRSVRFLGRSVRLESILCAGLILSWFCLTCFLLTLGATAFERLLPRKSAWGRWSIGAACAGAVLCNISISEEFLTVGTLLFWVLVPVLAQGVDKIKKMEKMKKSA